MALKIRENKDIYFVEGELNTTTSKYFESHCQSILNTQGTLTVDIGKISEIDRQGLKAIKALYHNARLNGKSFYIVGLGCKEIYDDIKLTSYAA